MNFVNNISDKFSRIYILEPRTRNQIPLLLSHSTTNRVKFKKQIFILSFHDYFELFMSTETRT